MKRQKEYWRKERENVGEKEEEEGGERKCDRKRRRKKRRQRRRRERERNKVALKLNWQAKFLVLIKKSTILKGIYKDTHYVQSTYIHTYIRTLNWADKGEHGQGRRKRERGSARISLLFLII